VLGAGGGDALRCERAGLLSVMAAEAGEDDLRPTLIALLEWGDKYLADQQGPSVVVRHRPSDGGACGQQVRVVLECAAGHTHVPPQAVYRAPGPGARFLDGAEAFTRKRRAN
jgi:hypothetical protein